MGKNPPANAGDTDLIPASAGKIPWTQEPGGQQFKVYKESDMTE